MMKNGKTIPEEVFKENYLKYHDANALYSGCMTKPLPYGEMEWVEPIFELSSNEKTFIYEVDLEYPP